MQTYVRESPVSGHGIKNNIRRKSVRARPNAIGLLLVAGLSGCATFSGASRHVSFTLNNAPEGTEIVVQDQSGKEIQRANSRAIEFKQGYDDYRIIVTAPGYAAEVEVSDLSLSPRFWLNYLCTNMVMSLASFIYLMIPSPSLSGDSAFSYSLVAGLLVTAVIYYVDSSSKDAWIPRRKKIILPGLRKAGTTFGDSEFLLDANAASYDYGRVRSWDLIDTRWGFSLFQAYNISSLPQGNYSIASPGFMPIIKPFYEDNPSFWLCCVPLPILPIVVYTFGDVAREQDAANYDRGR